MRDVVKAAAHSLEQMGVDSAKAPPKAYAEREKLNDLAAT